MNLPRNLWPLVAAALLLWCGCNSPKPDNDIAAALSLKLIDIEAKIDAGNVKLDELAKRPHIFPLIPIGRPGEAAQIHDGPQSVLVAPDVRAAIGFQLKAAGALVGNDKVVGFFEDMASEIRKTVAPVDIGGHLDAQARKLGGDKINSLLSQ